MCIGYCHQIQCDVIMLCDNLLMITTGMEIIPLNIHIYITTRLKCAWFKKKVPRVWEHLNESIQFS